MTKERSRERNEMVREGRVGQDDTRGLAGPSVRNFQPLTSKKHEWTPERRRILSRLLVSLLLFSRSPLSLRLTFSSLMDSRSLLLGRPLPFLGLLPSRQSPRFYLLFDLTIRERLASSTSFVSLAKLSRSRSKRSRFAVRRWQNNEAQPAPRQDLDCAFYFTARAVCRKDLGYFSKTGWVIEYSCDNFLGMDGTC